MSIAAAMYPARSLEVMRLLTVRYTAARPTWLLPLVEN